MDNTPLKKGFLILVAFFSLLILNACQKPLHAEPPLPTAIVVEQKVYEEVSTDRIKELHLSVDSCVGLSEIGEFESQDDHSWGIAYCHPNPLYPNLVVAMIDEKPTVFQFANFLGFFSVSFSEIKTLYDISSSESISEITISRQRKKEKPVALKTITETEQIGNFYKSLDELSPSVSGFSKSQEDGEDSQNFPVYFIDVKLANEYSLEFTYYPKLEQMYICGIFFRYGVLMKEWVDTQLNDG